MAPSEARGLVGSCKMGSISGIRPPSSMHRCRLYGRATFTFGLDGARPDVPRAIAFLAERQNDILEILRK